MLHSDRSALLHHGGRLRIAAQQYGIPLSEWLDLSTGINPNGWPVPQIPAALWQRLPEEDDGLEAAARSYYGTEQLLPVAGSQAAIQALPHLRAACVVRVLDPGYAEHGHAWRRAGHSVHTVTAEQLREGIPPCDVLLLINPNNPTGEHFAIGELLEWHMQLAAHGGWLIVDEAFMDVTPEQSLTSYAPQPGLIVLRSLGKFFGLAGARAGFVCAERALLSRLHSLLGPWTLSAPSRYIATAALNDRDSQRAARLQLQQQGSRLHALLAAHQLTPDGGCALFQWIRTDRAQQLHEALARQGILTRLFTTPASLRFGLPGDEAEWQRLDTALQRLEPIP